MRRVARDANLDAVTVALVVGFVVLRLVASLGRPIAVFPDTPSYFAFDLWGGVRFPVVTAIYSLVGDHRALVDLQAVAGALCWALAAVVAGSVLTLRGVRHAFQGLVLALGLTRPVTSFDSVLLSESLAISLTVVLAAFALRFAARPTSRTAIVVFVLGALWGMTRQMDALLLGLAAVVIAVVGAGQAYRRVTWRLAAGFLAVALVGLLLASSTSQIQQYNTAQILVRRVLPDPERTRWFEDRGMPDNGGAVITPPLPAGIVDPAVALQRDRRFGRWLEREGPSTYLRYLLAHPGFVVTEPFTDDGALPALAVGTSAYGSSRQVLPGIAERLSWPRQGGEQAVLALVVVGVLVAAGAGAARSAARRRALAGAGSVLVVAAGSLVLVTHAAGWEYERLLVPIGVAARVAVLWLAAALAGGVSEPAASEPPGRAPRRRGAPSSGEAAGPGPHSATAPDAPGSSAARGAGLVPDLLGTPRAGIRGGE